MGTRTCPAPLRSRIDIHLERDVATYHSASANTRTAPSARPVPLYMRESRFSIPPAPPKIRTGKEVRRNYQGSLGQSQATRSKSSFQQAAWTTTQREEVLVVTDAQMTAISSSQTRACQANKANSLTSDPFCSKRADGSVAPPLGYQQNTYTTTQGDTDLGQTEEQARAYIMKQAAACKANKANSNTSQPLR